MDKLAQIDPRRIQLEGLKALYSVVELFYINAREYAEGKINIKTAIKNKEELNNYYSPIFDFLFRDEKNKTHLKLVHSYLCEKIRTDADNIITTLNWLNSSKKIKKEKRKIYEERIGNYSSSIRMILSIIISGSNNGSVSQLENITHEEFSTFSTEKMNLPFVVRTS